MADNKILSKKLDIMTTDTSLCRRQSVFYFDGNINHGLPHEEHAAKFMRCINLSLHSALNDHQIKNNSTVQSQSKNGIILLILLCSLHFLLQSFTLMSKLKGFQKLVWDCKFVMCFTKCFVNLICNISKI